MMLETHPKKGLLLLVPVFTQTLLALVRRHLVSFSLFSAWHFSPFFILLLSFSL